MYKMMDILTSEKKGSKVEKGESSLGKKVWREALEFVKKPLVCSFCDMEGHSAEGCWERIFLETGRDVSKGSFSCDFCGLRGHKSDHVRFEKNQKTVRKREKKAQNGCNPGRKRIKQ